MEAPLLPQVDASKSIPHESSAPSFLTTSLKTKVATWKGMRDHPALWLLTIVLSLIGLSIAYFFFEKARAQSLANAEITMAAINYGAEEPAKQVTSSAFRTPIIAGASGERFPAVTRFDTHNIETSNFLGNVQVNNTHGKNADQIKIVEGTKTVRALTKELQEADVKEALEAQEAHAKRQKKIAKNGPGHRSQVGPSTTVDKSEPHADSKNNPAAKAVPKAKPIAHQHRQRARYHGTGEQRVYQQNPEKQRSSEVTHERPSVLPSSFISEDTSRRLQQAARSNDRIFRSGNSKVEENQNA